jgi:hypothetical protein
LVGLRVIVVVILFPYLGHLVVTAVGWIESESVIRLRATTFMVIACVVMKVLTPLTGW